MAGPQIRRSLPLYWGESKRSIQQPRVISVTPGSVANGSIRCFEGAKFPLLRPPPPRAAGARVSQRRPVGADAYIHVVNGRFVAITLNRLYGAQSIPCATQKQARVRESETCRRCCAPPPPPPAGP